MSRTINPNALGRDEQESKNEGRQAGHVIQPMSMMACPRADAREIHAEHIYQGLEICCGYGNIGNGVTR